MSEIATRPAESTSLAAMSTDQLKYIANTEFVPKAMRGNLPAILACVATGRAMGLPDMEALRSIHIIDGKATMAAELMVKLARRAGHSLQFEQGDGFAKATGTRKDNGDTMTVTWTMDMAARAGLANKDNYKKHPETMLVWRAASQLCRFLFPDVLGGVSYTPDEAELTPEERIGETLTTTIPASVALDDSIEVEAVEEPEADLTLNSHVEGESEFERMAAEAQARGVQA